MTSPVIGWNRLLGLEEELERIKEKRARAVRFGATPEALEILDSAIAMLGATIGKAAVNEAHRELHAALALARGLRDGRPPPPQPAPGSPGDDDPDSGDDPKKGKDDDDDDDDDDPDTGGGGGGGGGNPGGGNGGGFFAIPEAPPAHGKTGTIPDPTVISVRSANTIWTWNRYKQSWIAFTFPSEIIEVKDIAGGLLVIAQHGAVIWDAKLCSWLPALVTDQTLVTAQSAAGGSGSGTPSGGGTTTAAVSYPIGTLVPDPRTHVVPIPPVLPADLLTSAGVPPASALSPDPSSFPPPPPPDPAEPITGPDDNGGF